MILTSDERAALLDAWELARRLPASRVGLVGYGIAHLIGPDGGTRQLVPFANTITDAGDTYVAGKIIAAIPPVSPGAPTAASGMKLGTGSTAVNKGAGTGIALTTYLTGSNAAFDASYPQTAALGTNLGTNAIYRTTWAAGTATSATINEVVIANDAGTNLTSSAPNTYSRSVFGSVINKGASDSLAVTWNWKALGT